MKPSQTIFDYAKLRGAIREQFGTEGNFAKAIHRSPNYVSNVFQGKSNFSALDISKSAESLGIGLDEIGRYFFRRRSLSDGEKDVQENCELPEELTLDSFHV